MLLIARCLKLFEAGNPRVSRSKKAKEEKREVIKSRQWAYAVQRGQIVEIRELRAAVFVRREEAMSTSDDGARGGRQLERQCQFNLLLSSRFHLTPLYTVTLL